MPFEFPGRVAGFGFTIIFAILNRSERTRRLCLRRVTARVLACTRLFPLLCNAKCAARPLPSPASDYNSQDSEQGNQQQNTFRAGLQRPGAIQFRDVCARALTIKFVLRHEEDKTYVRFVFRELGRYFSRI